MSILVNKDTKVITQGMTGDTGTFHTEQALAYGTQMVVGVTPARAAASISVSPFTTPCPKPRPKPVRPLRASTSRRRSPRIDPRGDRRRDRADHRDHRGIPVLDMVRVKRALQGSKSRLIGPNCPGVLTPGECKIGIMPGSIFKKGSVGVVSRSGTLTYEAVHQTTQVGLGQTTAVGIGGDPVNGTNFIDVLDLFLDDEETESIIMIGEIGGSAEEEAAEFIKQEAAGAARSRWSVSSPAARLPPPHAGAIVSGGQAGRRQDRGHGRWASASRRARANWAPRSTHC